MATPTLSHAMALPYIADNDSPDDPNVFTLGEIATVLADSAAVSSITSQVTSAAASGALDSTPVSTADSKAVSSASRASVADSKALSVSGNVSVADSKALSVSLNVSVADSKATSVANAPSVSTALAVSQNTSVADSKASSVAAYAVPLPAEGRGVTTLSGYIANNAVFNVLDYLAAGDGVQDDTELIQDASDAADAAGGGTVLLPRGTYKITATVTGSDRVRFVAEPGAVIDMSSITTNIPAISISGSRGTATTLTANADEGDVTLSVTSTSGFAVDGWALLYSTETIGSVGTKGEMVRIASVGAGSLTLYSVINDSYTTATTASIAPITMVESPSVEGIRFVGSSNSANLHQGVYFEYCLNAGVRSCEFSYCHHAGVLAIYCVGVRVSDNHFEDSLATGTAYGFVASRATQDVVFTGNTGRRLRHLFTAGSSATVGQGGLPRRMSVTGNSAFECEDAGFDCHTGEDVVFDGNTVVGTGTAADTGIIFQGSRVTISNNAIRNIGSSGIVVQQLSARHMSAIVTGNNLQRTGTLGAAGAGIIVDPQATWDDYNGIVISDNTVVDHGGTDPAIMVDDVSGGAYQSRGLVISGNAIVYRIVGGRGIDISGVDEFVIADNNIRMEGSTVLEAISAFNCNDGTISGNTTNGVDATNGGRGIRLTTCVGVVITGNRLKNQLVGVLFASDVTDSLVADNDTRLCTTYYSLSTGSGNRLHASGSGSPESAVSAPVGSVWQRTDGGSSTCFYVKESGTGNTGWVGK